MRNRLQVASTSENDGFLLPEGVLTIDEEKKAVRFHDGETVGGYEIVGTRAYEPPLGPGPTELITGDMQRGFFGEVTNEELISYADLSSETGLSAGTLQNEGVGWLKFAYQERILFIAQQSARHTVSWDDIDAVDAVYGDSDAPTVRVGDDTLTVRLLTGSDTDPESGAGGEWNALLYPIHVDDPDGDSWGIDYTDADLNVGTGDGRLCWTQETSASDDTRRVYRGFSSVSYFDTFTSSGSYVYYGWRPCLELTV